MESLAFVSPDGSMDVDTELTTEEQIWSVFLGFPDEGEIQEAKRKGYRVVRVRIEVLEDGPA